MHREVTGNKPSPIPQGVVVDHLNSAYSQPRTTMSVHQPTAKGEMNKECESREPLVMSRADFPI